MHMRVMMVIALFLPLTAESVWTPSPANPVARSATEPATSPPNSTDSDSVSGRGEISIKETSREEDEKIDAILARLQERSDGIRDIQCNVKLTEDNHINMTRRTKVGSIRFLMTKPNPHFLVHFKRTAVDAVVGKPEWYLFDGYWFYQVLARTKQITKREVVAKGEVVDLFDIETAPFPLPFGQSKTKIRRHFEIKLAAPKQDDPENTDHLVCVPKPDSRLERKYDRLEFFIHKDINLPVRVIAEKSNGTETLQADFPGLSETSINTGLTKEDFTEPKAWSGFKRVVEPLPPARETTAPKTTEKT